MMIRANMVTQAGCFCEWHRFLSRSGRRAGLVVLLLLLLQHSVFAQSGATVPQTPVRGEMVLLTLELVVVKSVEGTNILIPIGKDAKLDSLLKVGDRVEVVVSPDNQASAVKKLMSDPPR